MGLGRVVNKLCKTDILLWDFENEEWVESNARGGLQTFDRFISDRDFGQRKRSLLTPLKRRLPKATELIKLSGIDTAYIPESLNYDVMGDNPHACVYMLQEAPYETLICTREGKTLPSGVVTGSEEKVIEKTWGNLTRYSHVNSNKFLEAKYTVMTVYLPFSSKVKEGHTIKMASTVLDVHEVTHVLNYTMVRAQERRP